MLTTRLGRVFLFPKIAQGQNFALASTVLNFTAIELIVVVMFVPPHDVTENYSPLPAKLNAVTIMQAAGPCRSRPSKIPFHITWCYVSSRLSK